MIDRAERPSHRRDRDSSGRWSALFRSRTRSQNPSTTINRTGLDPFHRSSLESTVDSQRQPCLYGSDVPIRRSNRLV